MNDFGVLVALEHELEGGAAEEGVALGVVALAVESSAVEEIMRGVGLDEEALEAVDEAEIDIAMDGGVVKRDHEVGEGAGESPDAVVAHAVVFGEDELDCMAADGQFVRQTLSDVSESAYFGDGGTLRRNHDDVHRWLLDYKIQL